MRIGLLSQWYEPEPTPTPSVLARELQRRQHEVRVLTGFPNYPMGHLYDGYRMKLRHDSLVSGVPVRRVALYLNHGRSKAGLATNYGTFAISASVLGGSWFKDIEALWVYNSPPTVGLPTWLVKSRYHPRVVMHLMDLWPESLRASGYGGSLLRSSAVMDGLNRWLAMTYNVVDAIACTSRSQMALLVERGVAPDKLSYVPVWTDESVFHPAQRDEALAASLGVTAKLVLLYAGSIGEPQGLDVLLDACHAMADDQRFHCLVAGSGRSEMRLRRRAEELQLPNITFLGRWPIDDMTRLMSIGDVHLVSLKADALAEIAMPGKVIATMACAKPMIVAALGDAAAVVTDASAGWTCCPGDASQLTAAIQAVLASDPEDLQAMGRRGRAAYEALFSLNSAVTRLEQLLAARDVAKEISVLGG